MADNLTPKEEFLLNPVEEHNITDAAIASFETNFKHPVKVTVPITPQQDLHGMPNPYPAGASVNLIPDGTDTSNGYVAGQHLNVDGTTTANTNWYISEYIPLNAETTYTWSNRVNTSIAPSICFYDENKDFISGVNINNLYSYTFVPPEGAVYCRSSQTTYAYQQASSSNGAFQLEVGSTATAYRRYSNICPIEGYTGATIYHTGANLLNGETAANILKTGKPSQVSLGEDADGKYVQLIGMSGADVSITKTLKFKENTRYTIILTGKNESSGVSSTHIRFVYSDGNSTEIHWSNPTEIKTIAVTSTANKTVKAITTVTRIYNTKIYYEKPFGLFEGVVSTSSFEEYQGTTLPITFTDPSTGDPTTVYGGTLTLNKDGSVDLVSRLVSYNIPSSRWSWRSSIDCWYISRSALSPLPINIASSNSSFIGYCSICKFDTYVNVANSRVANAIAFSSYSISNWLVCNIGNSSTRPPDMQVVMQRATNATYHFPNVGQLKAFLGQNNVWSDIGNVNVKYLTQNSATGLEYRGDRALELRRRAMIGDAPTIHTTIGSEETGGLASFKSYIKAPVKKIEIPFGPKQDLHGYDYPWPAGGGKNLFNVNGDLNPVRVYGGGAYDYSSSTTVSGSTITMAPYNTSNGRRIKILEVLANTTYTISLDSSVSWYLHIYDADIIAGSAQPNIIFDTGTKFNSVKSFTFTPESNGYLYFGFPGGTGDSDGVVSNIQLELGSTATAYAPYENICPIEGRDRCEIIAGLNLVPLREDVPSFWPIRGYINPSTGGIIGSSTYRTSIYQKAIPNKYYTFSASESRWLGICFYNDQYTKLSFKEASGRSITLRAPANSCYYRLYFQLNPQWVKLEFGQAATEYKPSNRFSLTFNQSGDHAFLPIQDGTGDPSPENVRPIHPGLTITRDDDSVLSVYGGTLTVNADGTGSLASNMALVDLGDFTYTKNAISETEHYYFTSNNNSVPGAVGCANYIADGSVCTNYKCVGLLTNDDNSFSVYTGAKRINVKDYAKDNYTVEEFKAAMSGIKLAYVLRTPITYTLSVTETNRALEAMGLTQHIGPLYGGTVTINPDGSADVEVTQGIINHIDDLWGYPYRSYKTGAIVVSDMPKLNGWSAGKCNIIRAKSGGNIGDEPQDKPSISWGWGDKRIYLWKIGLLAEQCLGHVPTESEIIEWLNGMNFMCNYPLETPQTYHFSNLEQLKVWLGENNFWCDISDDITVKYWNRG